MSASKDSGPVLGLGLVALALLVMLLA